MIQFHISTHLSFTNAQSFQWTFHYNLCCTSLMTLNCLEFEDPYFHLYLPSCSTCFLLYPLLVLSLNKRKWHWLLHKYKIFKIMNLDFWAPSKFLWFFRWTCVVERCICRTDTFRKERHKISTLFVPFSITFISSAWAAPVVEPVSTIAFPVIRPSLTVAAVFFLPDLHHPLFFLHDPGMNT